VGSCDCPAAQMLTESGSCPGRVTFPAESAGLGGECFGGPCFEGVTDLDQVCCAEYLTDPANDDRSPDLSDVNISPNFGCHSPAAQFIANGICLGSQNCTFVLDNTHEYNWDYQEKYETVCDLDALSSTGLNSPAASCSSMLLDAHSNFTDCPASMDGGRAYELVVVGVCADDFMSLSFPYLGEFTFEKATLIQFISYVDCGIIVAFLYAIHWLRVKEQESIRQADGNVCTPSDYTVLVQGLPPHENLKSLEATLRAHFSQALSEFAGVEKKGEEKDLSIFDINFAVNNRQEINIMKTRGDLARLKDKLENEVYWMKKFGKYKGKVSMQLTLFHVGLCSCWFVSHFASSPANLPWQ